MTMIVGYSRASTALPGEAIGIIQGLGIDSDLVLCLDAGDINSYAGSGAQQWDDVSGQGNHYNRGTTSGSQSTDPTFNGAAGNLSSNEYFSCDGGDYFSPVSATSFDDDWHKNNATYTLAFFGWIPNAGTTNSRYLMSNITFVGGTVGLVLELSNSNTLQTFVDSGDMFNSWGSVTSIDEDWVGIILSVDEGTGAGGSHWNVNGSISTFDGSYSAPSGSDPTSSWHLGALPNGNGKVPNGTRYSVVCAWDRALSQSESGNFMSAIGARWGL